MRPTPTRLRYWKGEGHGVSGAVAGLLVKWTAESSFMDPIVQTGYIIRSETKVSGNAKARQTWATPSGKSLAVTQGSQPT